MAPATLHARGALLTLLGVLVLSFDALLIRLSLAETWTVVFWRGLGSGVVMLVAARLMDGPGLVHRFTGLGNAAFIGAPLYGLSSVLFVYAINNTAVANVLIVLATMPLMTVAFSRLLLGERIRTDTIVASAVVLAGLVIVFSDSIGAGTWSGDLAAVCSGTALALFFTLLRQAGDVNTLPITGIGSVLAALGVLAIGAAPFAVPVAGLPWLALLSLAVIPLAFALITAGPRYLPVPEVSLIMLLESVTGPTWVWLALGETPSRQVLLGGAVVMTTLLVYFTRRQFQARRRATLG
ncbi:MAG: DMT family transporter [Azospirillaceae bacterium]